MNKITTVQELIEELEKRSLELQSEGSMPLRFGDGMLMEMAAHCLRSIVPGTFDWLADMRLREEIEDAQKAD